jgi:hypothetical protein
VENDRKTSDLILSLIREEEAKTDLLKQQFSSKPTPAVAVVFTDAIETNESAAAEQSFNREQVQEQEQVSFCRSSIGRIS